MGGLADKYIQQYAKILINDGYKCISTAYKNKDYNNRTYNLHDSYGSCLYLDGKEYPNSRRYVGRQALVGKKDLGKNLILGRAEIDNYFDEYKPKKEGFELVVAVAIFYGRILEKGGGRLKRKYKVISGATTEVESIAKKHKGIVRTIGL